MKVDTKHKKDAFRPVCFNNARGIVLQKHKLWDTEMSRHKQSSKLWRMPLMIALKISTE